MCLRGHGLLCFQSSLPDLLLACSSAAGGDARHEIGGVGVEGELGIEKAAGKDSWNPDSICHSVIAPVFRTRVPLWMRSQGRLGPRPVPLPWRMGFPYTPCGGFRGSRWRGPAGMSYSCCSACLQPADPSRSRSLQSSCGASA